MRAPYPGAPRPGEPSPLTARSGRTAVRPGAHDVPPPPLLPPQTPPPKPPGARRTGRCATPPAGGRPRVSSSRSSSVPVLPPKPHAQTHMHTHTRTTTHTSTHTHTHTYIRIPRRRLPPKHPPHPPHPNPPTHAPGHRSNNTASEHAMMLRLMVDDITHWARDYKVWGGGWLGWLVGACEVRIQGPVVKCGFGASGCDAGPRGAAPFGPPGGRREARPAAPRGPRRPRPGGRLPV
jgi:hypothetical protein